MTATVRISVYATFEVMHGRKASLEELVERLRPFSRWSIIYACATVGMILKLWQRGDWDRTHYGLLINAFFEPLRGDWYRLCAREGEPELVFHRRQLLLIMKLAIEHCAEVGADLFDAIPGYFGTILLMANDQFHYGLYPFAEQDQADEWDKVVRMLAELVPVNEYAGCRIENRLIRSHLMMTKYTERLCSHPDFINVANIYEELTGVSLQDHEALTFALFTRCSMVTLDGLRTNSLLAVIKPGNFSNTAIDEKTVITFLGDLASTPNTFKAELRNARRLHREHGTNDFTLFRKKPLVKEALGMVPVDMIFVMDKFEAGPYWRVNDTNKENGDRLRRFWGPVFEAYVNDQLLAAPCAPQACFVPDPRWSGEPNAQVCDGMFVDGESLVLLEYKASMFTAHSKYSGDYLHLKDEIVQKFVCEENENRKKGVKQLADAVVRLTNNDRALAIKGVDLSSVKRIYPLLVTLDDLGSTLLISRFLNAYFEKYLARESYSKEMVKPLLCTDIESLETILPFFDVWPLSTFLQHWLISDPRLMATLLAFPPDGLPDRRNEALYAEWNALSKKIESRLFPRRSEI